VGCGHVGSFMLEHMVRAAENINQLLRTLKQDTVKVQMFALKGLKQLLAERSEWIHHYLLSDEARTLWVTACRHARTA
jgi:hypothetical protein